MFGDMLTYSTHTTGFVLKTQDLCFKKIRTSLLNTILIIYIIYFVCVVVFMYGILIIYIIYFVCVVVFMYGIVHNNTVMHTSVTY